MQQIRERPHFSSTLLGQGATLGERPARPAIERLRGPPDHVEIHDQGSQLLTGRVVQIERETPSFLILQSE